MKKLAHFLLTVILVSFLVTGKSQNSNATSTAFHNPEAILTGSFLLDENFGNTGTINEQRFPKVASDGTVFLSAWTDYRTLSSQNPDIYASRIDEEGNVMDIGGIPICTFDRVQYIVDVVFDGVNFIVVWVDEREIGQPDIYFARVTPQGTVLDPDGIQATFGIDMVTWNNPAVAVGDDKTLILWCEEMTNGTHAVNGLRIDQNANILDPESIVVSDTVNDSSGEMAASFDGSNFLVVWESGYYSLYDDIRASRLATDGTVLDPGGFTVAHNPDDQWTPQVSYGDSKYLVVWTDSQDDDNNIVGTFVFPDGTVNDTTGFSISAMDESQEFPSVDFDGSNFVVAWTDKRWDWDMYAVGVTPEGTVMSTTGWGVGAWTNTYARYGSIACGTDYFLVVWENLIFSLEVDIQGGRISTNDYLMPDWGGFDISIGTYGHSNPASAFDGSNYLVVWEDFRNGNAEIWGTRVSAAGAILDPEGIQIGFSDSLRMLRPSVSFNGTDYVVIWGRQNKASYSKGAEMTRVSTEGIVLDDPAITVINENNFCWNFSICSGNEESLVVWYEYDNSSTYDIHGIFIDNSGNVGSSFGVCTADNYQDYPRVAFNGSNYLVVWEDSRNGSEDIYGTLVTPDGQVVFPDGLLIGDAGSWDYQPSVTSNGSDFFITWYGGNSSGQSIYSSIVADDGSIVLDTETLFNSASFEYAQKPTVVFDGQNYIVCWHIFSNAHPDQDILGVVVDTSGTPGQEFTIDDAAGNQFSPALCGGNGNQLLAAYSGFTEEINGEVVNTIRTYGNFIDELIGVEEISAGEKFGFNFYPNPASKLFQVSGFRPACRTGRFQVGSTRIELFDIYGKRVELLFEGKTNGDNFEFDVSHLPAGIYFCQLTVDRQSFTRKLIIQR